MAASTGAVLAELRRHNLSQIARCLGVKKQAVSGWQQVPATRVRSVSEITGHSSVAASPGHLRGA